MREKCLANNSKEQEGNMEDLNKGWETVSIGFDRLE
jgi:hypothetical protein